MLVFVCGIGYTRFAKIPVEHVVRYQNGDYFIGFCNRNACVMFQHHQGIVRTLFIGNSTKKIDVKYTIDKNVSADLLMFGPQLACDAKNFNNDIDANVWLVEHSFGVKHRLNQYNDYLIYRNLSTNKPVIERVIDTYNGQQKPSWNPGRALVWQDLDFEIADYEYDDYDGDEH